MKYIFFLLTAFPMLSYSQTNSLSDTLTVNTVTYKTSVLNNRLTYKTLAVPAILTAYGFAALGNKNLIKFNLSTKEEVREDHPNFATHIDSYSQFFPAATVFALHAFGYKGIHNTADAAILYAMSMGISTAIVFPLKKITKEERPDNSNFNSFPSGHTSTAFVSAEFLRREYGQSNPWLAVAGYAVATGTGMLRVYNNKHWISDVAAGAGIGIASTKIAYWLYPKFNSKNNKKVKNNVVAIPTLSGKTYGFSLIKNLP